MGATHDKVFDVSYASALQQAGYTVEVVPNQGRGAAMARIESARRMFNAIWFHEPTTAAGLEALGWYHEKRDDVRSLGLGPAHDWSSHAADAFGLLCLVAEAGFRGARQLTLRRKGSAMAV
jgi:phage terminase large subunit